MSANALVAYNAGATGSGVKIGIIDTGINPSLPDFAGRVDSASRDVAGQRQLSDDAGYGTAVAAIAAGAHDGSEMQGVAFNSTIVALRADTPGTCGTADDCGFEQSAVVAGIDAARQAGAKVINLSIGGESPTRDMVAAMQRAVDAGMVIVLNGGSYGDTAQGADPDIFALTAAQDFASNVIIAGSVGVEDGSGVTNTNVISDFSNRAGVGKSNFLTALGLYVAAPDQTGEVFYWSGSDFAAPTISGAVALLAQAFPNLTGQQIVKLLFDTADDLGDAGIDSVYGHGRLNLTRAFAPAGQTTMAASSTVVTNASVSKLPSAAGDAAGGGVLGAIVLDGYSRAYVVNLASTLRLAAEDQPLQRTLAGNLQTTNVGAGPIAVSVTMAPRSGQSLGFDRLGIGPQDARAARLIAASAVTRLDGATTAAFGLRESGKALEQRLQGAEFAAFLIATDSAANPGFRGSVGSGAAVRRQMGKFGVTLSAESGQVWNDLKPNAASSPYRLAGASTDRNIGKFSLAAGLSRLDERESVLGGRMNPVLGGGGSSTLFVDFAAGRELGSGFRARVSGRHGWTDFAGGKFQTGAYSFDVAKVGVVAGNDQIGLRFSQPLRVESGGFDLFLPTGYDYPTQTATSSWEHYSMTPSGREVDAELAYSKSVIGDSGWLAANLFVRRNPGHVASVAPDIGSAVRFMLKF